MRADTRSEIEANSALRALAEQRRPRLGPDIVLDRCGGGTMLVDIGCGSGAFLHRVRGRYDTVVGIDFIPLRRTQFENVPLLRADLRNGIPLADAVADTLTAVELIEHVADPVRLMREAFRIARPGGEFILTTPNVRYIRHLLRLAVQGRGPKTSAIQRDDILWDGGHIHYFTAKDIVALFRDAGFVAVRAKALIGPNGFLRPVRGLFARWPGSPLVREFFTGRLLVTGRKPEDRAA